ncbi:MAG TPA: SwmB domain-containing protein, partial [Candidatus Cloacimonadota bacterium]|nr:SwmB domain-containing protein [Candidatus Cloacimonadota bacterium]
MRKYLLIGILLMLTGIIRAQLTEIDMGTGAPASGEKVNVAFPKVNNVIRLLNRLQLYLDSTNNLERKILDGALITTGELNRLVGVTAPIQTQINAKADTSLSNLSSVAINSNLLPAASASANLGSGALPFGKIFATATQISSLMVGDSTSATKVELDSLGLVDSKIASYIGSDTTSVYIPVDDRQELTTAAIMLTDTIHTNGLHILYTQWQVDSIVATLGSGWDSTYIYERHDSLLTAFTELQESMNAYLPPIFESAEVGDSASRLLRIIFSKDMATDSIPDDEQFVFTEGVDEIDITSVSISNDTVFLVLATTPQKDSTLLIDYTKPTPTATNHTLEDSDENEVKSFTNK